MLFVRKIHNFRQLIGFNVSRLRYNSDHPDGFTNITLPLICISVGVLVLISECTFRRAEPVSYWISILGLTVTGLLIFPGLTPLTGLPAVTSAGGLFCLIFVVAALMTVIFSRDYLRRNGGVQGEYYLMVLFSVAGMTLMAVAQDLVMLFLGLELMSICLYVLAGYIRKRVSGNEASLKYFLLGAFITGFILYGIALVYGSTGSLSIAPLVERMQTPGQPLLFWAGVILILAGFAFKVGAFPFHMWIPDVYQGAPTPVTAFMATGAKTAAFSVLIIVFSRRAAVDADLLRDIVAFLAAGSMIIGNILALAHGTSWMLPIQYYADTCHRNRCAMRPPRRVSFTDSYFFMNPASYCPALDSEERSSHRGLCRLSEKSASPR